MSINIQDRLRASFPHVIASELERWIVAGREYADRLDKLPASEREAVAQLFCAFGLSRDPHARRAIRRSIDVVIRPWYSEAGVDHAHA